MSTFLPSMRRERSQVPFGIRSVNSRRICSVSPDSEASSRSTAIRSWASSRSERVSSYRSAAGRSAATWASSLRSSAFAFQATAVGQAIPRASAATADPARNAREILESDPSRGGESRSIGASPSAAPNAPRRAKGSGAVPLSPAPAANREDAAERPNAPRTRNTTPPSSISFPSFPYHPCGANRSTGPSPTEDGGSTNPRRASDSPSSDADPGEQGPEAQKNGSPAANRVHSTAAPAARSTAAVRPASPDGPPGPDSAAPTAHAAGTAADSDRPARVTISSHRSMYSEGVATTTRWVFPPAEGPASRRNPWRSSAGGTGKRRSSSIPTASRRSLPFIGGNAARARYTRSAGRTRTAPAPTSPLRATNSPSTPSISS